MRSMLRKVLGLSAAAVLACLAIVAHAGDLAPKDSFWDMTDIRKVPLKNLRGEIGFHEVGYAPVTSAAANPRRSR